MPLGGWTLRLDARKLYCLVNSCFNKEFIITSMPFSYKISS